jgi:hypothetical protein
MTSHLKKKRSDEMPVCITSITPSVHVYLGIYIVKNIFLAYSSENAHVTLRGLGADLQSVIPLW